MNNNVKTSWYVVYTKPKWEKKVAELLHKKDIEHYCPLNKVQKQWHDRKKIIMEPLFNSYVFVRASLQQHSYIKAVPGIVSFVHWLGAPAIVRDEEIETIKCFLQEHSVVRVEKIKVNINDTVKIMQGPLMHREGKIVQVTNNMVKVELPSMGYVLIAYVSKTNIELTGSSVSDIRLIDHPHSSGLVG